MTQQLEHQREQPRWKLLAFILVYAAALKVLPFVLYLMGMDVEKNFAIYPWNFSPIFAICLFGGAMYKLKSNALWIPLAAMLIGDLGIWAVTGKLEWAFYPTQIVVYAAFAICTAIGFLLREKRTWGRVAGAGVASCLTFFLITNFASWVSSTTYPQTIDGLMICYTAGLPFLKNSLIATAIFSGVLFSPVFLCQPAPAEVRSEMLATTAG